MRQSLLVATAILVVFIVSVGANVVQVNAGRSHPLQTGGPGNCIEGQQSVQEWCPGLEYKTWKRAKVCHGGQLVQETQECPTETQTQTQSAECSAGDEPKDVVYCKEDPTQWAARKECVDGAWKQMFNPSECPTCLNGEFEVLIWCPNRVSGGDVWHVRNHCVDGGWRLEKQLCGECKPGESKCAFTCRNGDCRERWDCNAKGLWDPGIKVADCFWRDLGICVIATATYGSEMAPEVVYMRYVRDGLIGSTATGKTLVNGFNAFYYSWSPTVASAIAKSEPLRATFRVILIPVVAATHAAGLVFTAMTNIGVARDVASVLTFVVAAAMTVTAYIVLPVLGGVKLIQAIRRHKRVL